MGGRIGMLQGIKKIILLLLRCLRNDNFANWDNTISASTKLTSQVFLDDLCHSSTPLLSKKRKKKKDPGHELF